MPCRTYMNENCGGILANNLFAIDKEKDYNSVYQRSLQATTCTINNNYIGESVL